MACIPTKPVGVTGKWSSERRGGEEGGVGRRRFSRWSRQSQVADQDACTVNTVRPEDFNIDSIIAGQGSTQFPSCNSLSDHANGALDSPDMSRDWSQWGEFVIQIAYRVMRS